MQYILLIYGDEQAWASAEDQSTMMQEYGEFTEWLRGSGKMVAGEALEPSPATTTVRVRDGRTLTTDGPFAETKEQLGGFYLIEAANLDDAIDAAARIPGARQGSIQVRPIFRFPQEG